MPRDHDTIIPDNMLVSEFIDGLYHPEFIPEDLDLNNFLENAEVVNGENIDTREQEVQRSLQGKKSSPAAPSVSTAAPGGVPVPLTEEEAEEADRQIATTLQRIQDTKDKINGIRELVDNQIKSKTAGSKGGGELSFKLDISRKKSLQRAIKRLFGIKTDTVTYSMYKEMLKAKQILEEEQAESYSKGFPDQTDKDDDKKGKRTKEDKDKKKKKKKKKKNSGFLERNSKGEEVDDSSTREETYERMFPKMGRDFVYREDFVNVVKDILDIVDPSGFKTTNPRTSVEARKKAVEYKDVIESGKDGSEIYFDLINIDEDEDEDL